MKDEQGSFFSGIGGHHRRRPGTTEWLTPPYILDALGGADSFDLDPCTPIEQPYLTARRRFTRADNGLLQEWEGRVWLNPPYTNEDISQWLGRLVEHGQGTALIFARTETEAFHRFVWKGASGIFFFEGRIWFNMPDGRPAKNNAGGPSVLCAYGDRDAEILSRCGLNGEFFYLRKHGKWRGNSMV